MAALSQFELLQTNVLLLTRRVERLESLERLARVNGKDAAEAEVIAIQLGFDTDIFVQSFKVLQRRQLARALKEKGWSASRIAKVMGCCERTAERWISESPAGEDSK